MKRIFKSLTACALAMLVLLAAAGCGEETASTGLDPKNPTTVTVWNYYNGDQLVAFEQLVASFNETVGLEEGIVVISVSQGDIGTLADSLLDSVEGKAGAQECPQLAAVYSETAYILEQKDALAPLDAYFTEEELSAYVPEFLEEGRFNENGDLMLFPVSKSSEVFAANATDWAAFAEATGVTLESIQTKEDLTAAAQAYYLWTDSLTPDVPEDGKALYGRDSIGNYIYIGSYQMGHELFQVTNGTLSVDLDRDTFKLLWDNYYVPYINGYFGAYANFRSEDTKTGKILALTSSSSGVGYLPSQVTKEDDSTHPIEMVVNQELPFADASVSAIVQQGASYCMFKGTEAQQQGAVQFLKWLTAPEQNIDFALMSGYSPVTIAANTEQAITEAFERTEAAGRIVLDTLIVGAEGFTERVAYATKPFDGSKEVRSLLEEALRDTAAADREMVEAAIAGGVTREAATAEFMTDEYFDAWFTALQSKVMEITQ